MGMRQRLRAQQLRSCTAQTGSCFVLLTCDGHVDGRPGRLCRLGGRCCSRLLLLARTVGACHHDYHGHHVGGCDGRDGQTDLAERRRLVVRHAHALEVLHACCFGSPCRHRCSRRTAADVRLIGCGCHCRVSRIRHGLAAVAMAVVATETHGAALGGRRPSGRRRCRCCCSASLFV